MPIASTTFDERISRIEAGQTKQTGAPPAPSKLKKRFSRIVKNAIKITACAALMSGLFYAWSTGMVDVVALKSMAMRYADIG